MYIFLVVLPSSAYAQVGFVDFSGLPWPCVAPRMEVAAVFLRVGKSLVVSAELGRPQPNRVSDALTVKLGRRTRS